MIKIQNYINGKLCPPVNDEYIDNVEPATGKIYSHIPNSKTQDIENAVFAAEEAFPIWSAMSNEERYRILNKIADLIERDIEKLAQAESIDNGKPLWLAKNVDIPRASSNFRFFATSVLHFSSESHEMVGTAINYTLRNPIGIVGCISPWNLPLYLFSWKIAPALATGNCVIAKPSEVTPMTAFLLSEICIEAGLPPGVLNIVHGLGQNAGEAMVKHPKIKAISFTGGTSTGQKIASVAAPMFKKLSLELGGKNPNIIFDDCDYDLALKTSVLSSFSNQGQICLCGSRIFIQRSIYDKFKKDFVAQTKELNIGDPNEKGNRIGALVSEAHMKKVLEHIRIAKEEGGKILTGGERVIVAGRCEDGYFVSPTIIEGLDARCRTNTEEIFGPVVTLIPFDTEDEVIDYANCVEYGLSCTIWSNDINKITRVSKRVQAGIIWVNCWLLRDLRTPFGGMKNSGVGREGGLEALRFFTEPKNVCIKYL